jgi:hypothetical protein
MVPEPAGCCSQPALSWLVPHAACARQQPTRVSSLVQPPLSSALWKPARGVLSSGKTTLASPACWVMSGSRPVRWPPGRLRLPGPGLAAATPSGSPRAGMCWSPQRGRSSRAVLTSSSRSHHRRPFMPTSVAIAAFADAAPPASAPVVRPGRLGCILTASANDADRHLTGLIQGPGASPRGRRRGAAGPQPSGTSKTRVPQLRVPVVVWLDLGGMYSVASHAESDVSSGTAKE